MMMMMMMMMMILMIELRLPGVQAEALANGRSREVDLARDMYKTNPKINFKNDLSIRLVNND